jgi:hypothetical protein
MVAMRGRARMTTTIAQIPAGETESRLPDGVCSIEPKHTVCLEGPL